MRPLSYDLANGGWGARSARKTPCASSKNADTGLSASTQRLLARSEARSKASRSFRAVSAYSCGQATSSVIIRRKSMGELNCLNHSMVQLPLLSGHSDSVASGRAFHFCWNKVLGGIILGGRHAHQFHNTVGENQRASGSTCKAQFKARRESGKPNK